MSIQLPDARQLSDDALQVLRLRLAGDRVGLLRVGTRRTVGRLPRDHQPLVDGLPRRRSAGHRFPSHVLFGVSLFWR